MKCRHYYAHVDCARRYDTVPTVDPFSWTNSKGEALLADHGSVCVWAALLDIVDKKKIALDLRWTLGPPNC
jgi:hypothetical protein